MQVFDTTHHSEPRITQVKLQRHKILKINEEKHTYNHPSLQHLCKSLFYCARSNTSASVSISIWTRHVYVYVVVFSSFTDSFMRKHYLHQSLFYQKKKSLTGFSLWSLKRAATKGQTENWWIIRDWQNKLQCVCIFGSWAWAHSIFFAYAWLRKLTENSPSSFHVERTL